MAVLRVLEKMGDKYTVSFSHSFIDFPIFRGRVHVSRLVRGVVFIGAEGTPRNWASLWRSVSSQVSGPPR